MSNLHAKLPTFEQLTPQTKGHPLEGHAWDIGNKANGAEKDNLGGKCQWKCAHLLLENRTIIAEYTLPKLLALHLLTPENVLQTKDEIRTGVRVQVDWATLCIEMDST